MKAFEKVYGALYSIQECKDEHWIQRWDAWKAALEWVYDKLDYSEEHEKLKDIINKELES